MRSILAGALICLSGCSAVLRGDVFSKPGVEYRLGVPPEGEWRRVGFAENDLAWVNKSTGHVISVNATCSDHGDAPLEVLTTHLLFGFSDRELKSQKLEAIDGREALRSKFTAKLDGVGAEIEVLVLKKNACVHDFSYISPEGHSDSKRAAFDALIAGFAQEKSP